MTPVTIGGPGWWIVDELMISSQEIFVVEGQECYEVLPAAGWGATLRGQDSAAAEVVGQGRYVPIDQVWVYRDGEGSTRRVDEVAPFAPLGWYDRVMADPSEPPPKRVARPARELPSLVGRTARWFSPKEGEWIWLKLLSEPLTSGPEFTVAACHPSDYWQAVFRRPPPRAWLLQLPLHAVWTY